MSVWDFVTVFSIGAFFSFEDVSLKDCGETKGCLRPPTCLENHCEYGATWRLAEINGTKYVEFELLGDVKSSDGFISLAFSKNPYFGGDGFVGCYFDDDSHEVTASAGYRPEVSMENKLYRQLESEKFLLSEGDNLGGSYNYSSNFLQCRFRRLVTPANKVNRLKDLAPPNKYYLIIQRGRNFSNAFASDNVVSNEAVYITSNMNDTKFGVKSRASEIIKMHICLMVSAWIFCFNVGVILSRCSTVMCPNCCLCCCCCCSFHPILMCICVGLTIVAVILNFVFCYVFSSLTAYPPYIIPILSLTVLILAVLNPFILFCRCHLFEKKRHYFNWTHIFVGTIAYILALATIMLVLLSLEAGALSSTLSYPLWILICFIIFQCCAEIILRVHCRRDKNIRLDRNRTHRDEVEQYQMASKTDGAPVPRPVEPEPSSRLFKYTMLGLYATVCAIVAVILVILIVVN